MIEEALHYNRDENSFTARFFERLFPIFKSDKNIFHEFLKTVYKKSHSNAVEHKINIKNIPDIQILKYSDSMLFLESHDFYSYYKKEWVDYKSNRVEFDCVIVGNDSQNGKYLIVFEVKCFTDLKYLEIQKQNAILDYYKKLGIITDYAHLALISYENLIRGKNIKYLFKDVNNFGVISWEDLKEYFDDDRIKFDVELTKLSKKVKMNGDYNTKRFLINKKA
jgi:hypothetical protein